MTIWRVGMLAVCVADPVHGGPSALKIRGIYRINRVVTDSRGNVGLGLVGFMANGWRGCYYASRFRPLIDQADDTALIARIKNCTPQREVVA